MSEQCMLFPSIYFSKRVWGTNLPWNTPGAGLDRTLVVGNLAQEIIPKAHLQKLRLIQVGKGSESPRKAEMKSGNLKAATLEEGYTTVLRGNQYATIHHEQFQNEGEFEVRPKSVVPG